MGDFLKELANHQEILYLFAAFVVILIIIFVMYILSITRSYEPSNHSSYMGRANRKKHNDYEQIKDKKPLRWKYLSNEPNANSNQAHKDWSASPPKESKSINQSIKNWEDFGRRALAQRKHIQETTNDEENVNNVILSDHTNDDPISAPISNPLKYEYLGAANGGQFLKLLTSDEKSFFRTWVENGTRKFEFHGNVEKALANINAIFDDVCEIDGKKNGATQIENIEPGTLTSQLKVDKPAKIKLT